MSADYNKYEQIVNLLKKSKPVFTESEAVTENVIRQIQSDKSSVNWYELVIEYIFGWVYIGWVRRSMIAVSFAVIILFGFQQSLIIKRISNLSEQRIQNGEPVMTGFAEEISSKMMIYRITGKRITSEKMTASKKEIDDMINSINKLQVKYRDLLKIIENDPQLKKYLEGRMNEINKTNN